MKSSLYADADRESRNLNVDTEWQLSSSAFHKIVSSFGQPNIDLFATRTNTKCVKYVSCKPDPYAFNIDAFTINWEPCFFYSFPPFSLILKTLNKIMTDKALLAVASLVPII